MRDPSVSIFNHYCETPESTVSFTLRNGDRVKGVISGFIKGDPTSDEPFILRWHLVTESDKHEMNFDPVGNPLGLIIEQEDVVDVRWSNGQQ